MLSRFLSTLSIGCILTIAVNAWAAEGTLTNFFIYNPTAASQGTQALPFVLASNLYTFSSTRVLLSINGGTFNELESQQGTSNVLWVSSAIGAYSTNQYQVRTNATRTTFSGYGYLNIQTQGVSSNWLYQVTNGLTGMRVVNTNVSVCSNLWPMPDLQFANGQWGIVGLRGYKATPDSIGYWTNLFHATNISVTLEEVGNLVFRARVTQLFNEPLWDIGEGTTIPARTGSNVVWLEMQAFRPIQIVRLRTDMEPGHTFEISGTSTNLNRLRYRNADGVYCTQFGGRIGYQWGSTTNDLSSSNGRDVLMDMESGISLEWNYYVAGDSDTVGGETETNTTHKAVGLTWPSGRQGGIGHYSRGCWYVWENTNATPTTPILGIGLGPMEGLKGVPFSGFVPFYYSSNSQAGFRVQVQHRDPTANYRTNTEFSYYLWHGTKTNITNSTSAYYWGMSDEALKVSDLSLAKWVEWKSDPTVFDSKTWNNLFIPTSYLTNLAYRMRGGEANLSNFLAGADSANIDVLQALADNSGYSTRVLLTNSMNQMSNIWRAHWERDGTLANSANFLQGGQAISEEASRSLVVLILKPFDGLSDAEVFPLKLMAIDYGRALFEDRFYPISAITDGDYLGSVGSANMPIQFRHFQNVYSMLNYPENTTGFWGTNYIATQTVATVERIINDAGAEFSTPHYEIASLTPVVESLLMLQNLASINLFGTAKLTNYVEHLISMQTPIEIRFGTTNRNRVSMSSGGQEADPLFNVLASGYASNNTAIFNRLQVTWTKQGKTMDTYFSPGVVLSYADVNSSSATNSVVSRNATGFWSHARHRFGTQYETAAWMKNGTFNDGKWYQNAFGSICAWMLGAPVLVEKNTFFTPVISGSMWTTGVTPTNAITTWTTTNTFDVNTASPWSYTTTTTNTVFAGFGFSTIANCRMSKSNDLWQRTYCIVSPSPTFDVVLMDDTFTNDNASMRFATTQLNTFGNLAGDMNVTVPVNNYGTSDLYLTGLGTTNWRGAGLTVINLTNAPWPNHPTTGVLVQVGMHLKGVSNAVHGTYVVTTVAPGETNLLLRAQTSNNLAQVVVATKTTAGFCTVTTNASNGSFYVVNGSEQLRAGTNTWEYSLRNVTNAAAIFQGTALTATNGIVLGGGPIEALFSGTNWTISIDGAAGTRTLTVPPAHTNGSPLLARAAGQMTIKHAGGAAITLQ